MPVSAIGVSTAVPEGDDPPQAAVARMQITRALKIIALSYRRPKVTPRRTPYLTQSPRVIVGEPDASNQSMPSLTRSNFRP